MSKYQHECVFAMEKVNELEFYKFTQVLAYSEEGQLATVGGLDIEKIMLGFIKFENC